MKNTPRQYRLIQLLLLLSWSCAARCLGETPPIAGEPSGQDQLAHLLDRCEAPPLALLAIPDLRKAAKLVSATRLGKTILDPQYEAGRSTLVSLLAGDSSAEAEGFWSALQTHSSGPIALVLSALPAKPGLQDLPFSLLLAARDQDGADSIRRAWEPLAARPGSPASAWRLAVVTAEDLTKAAPPKEWTRNALQSIGILRLALRLQDLPPSSETPARPAPNPTESKESDPPAVKAAPAPLPEWLRILRDWPRSGVEAAVWDVNCDGAAFSEQLRLAFRAGAESTFAKLLLSLRGQPQPWKSLASALPGGQDLTLLVQAEPAKLGEFLPSALQVLERKLRGKQWTRKYGDDEETQAPDRYRFFTGGLTGTFGLSARPSLTGEVRTILAAALTGQEVEAYRSALLVGLESLGGTFQMQERAPRIGRHAPLASTFQGRGFLPAPVLGLSEGWVWLCSNTGSYGELTSAFASGKTLLSDNPEEKAPEGVPAPPASALRLRANLNTMVPLLYAAWILSEQGPRLGNWKVPDTLLHPKDLVTKGLGIFNAELIREGSGIKASSHGPCPGGALLVVSWLEDMAGSIDDLNQRRAAAVRKKLDELHGQATGPQTPPRAEERP